MHSKFIKNTIYIVISIIIITIILIQPYNLICKISQKCVPINLSSLSFKKSGKKQIKFHFYSIEKRELKDILIFYPQEKIINVVSGKNINNFYMAKNISKNNITIKAHFNIEPDWVGKYLTRIECLCFSSQILDAGKSVNMPVRFRIEPEIESDIRFSNLEEIYVKYNPYIIEF